MSQRLNSRISALEKISPRPTTRQRLIERARGLSAFTGMPLCWAYIILRNDEPETGKSLADDDDQYIQENWAGNRAAFEEALNDCIRQLEANLDDQATISKAVKRICGPGSHAAATEATSSEASSASEPSASDLDLPTAA